MLVDTSGSMVSLVQQVGATIVYLGQHNINVRCIAGDTQVLFDEEITAAPMELPGGGGTDIVPLFKRANDYNPTGIVCFTDGYIPKWPVDPNVPVLWVIDNVEPPYGEFVAAK
jgi:predicted metal-dependent peptidase